jgi:hypothetical protein
MGVINPLVRDVDQGKPLPWPMEPRARLSTYAHQIGRGKPFPEPLEHNVGRNTLSSINVQLRESSDDVSTSAVSYTGHDRGFYQNPGQQPKFSWQPGAN